MNYARSDRLAVVIAAVSALSLGACRHAEEAHYGSIKDDHVVTGSVPKPKAVKMATAEAPKVAMAAPKPAPVATAPVPAPAPAPQISSAQPPAPPPRASVAIVPTPAPPPPPAPAPITPSVEQPLPAVEDAAGSAKMLSEGQSLFDSGKVLQARRRFIAAMNGPNPEVLLALGRTYDTYYLSRLPASDAAPDMQRALVLYERALERGANSATGDLERTRAILKIPR